MSKLLTGKDLKVGKRYAILGEYTSDDIGGCELNMNTFVVEEIGEDRGLQGSDVYFYGSHGTWCLFDIDDTELTFIEVVAGEEHSSPQNQRRTLCKRNTQQLYIKTNLKLQI